ncbi:hypothetical protein GHT06_022527 [Daphnia sinensis]|uniref:Uncharacterized protein n=1 Tax=Daphnia sinensis TaxID=1820382 RepID=A0AAD5KXB8_9CRUS|nr:hypothetical protein GHT06_022527 [Daphnia sinensis]
MKTTKINTLLKAPRFDNIKEDFDTKSRAACELLPLCLPGTDKSVNGPRHFFDYREESADRTRSIAVIDKRTSPFIFSHGKALHLAIEKQHWFQIEGPASDAVLILLAAYHVLDLCYSKNVKPTLQFLQINLLGLVDETSGTATETFYNMLDKVRQTL